MPAADQALRLRVRNQHPIYPERRLEPLKVRKLKVAPAFLRPYLLRPHRPQFGTIVTTAASFTASASWLRSASARKPW